jgi:hypothetical protein
MSIGRMLQAMIIDHRHDVWSVDGRRTRGRSGYLESVRQSLAADGCARVC